MCQQLLNGEDVLYANNDKKLKRLLHSSVVETWMEQLKLHEFGSKFKKGKTWHVPQANLDKAPCDFDVPKMSLKIPTI